MNKHNVDIDEIYERLMSTRRLIESKYQKLQRLEKEVKDEKYVIKKLEDSTKIIEDLIDEQKLLNMDFEMIFLKKFDRFEYWLVDGVLYVRDHYIGVAVKHVGWGIGEFREIEDGTRTYIKESFEANNMEVLYTNYVNSIIYFGVRNRMDLFKQIGNDDNERYEGFFWDYEYLEEEVSKKLEKNRYIMQKRKEKCII